MATPTAVGTAATRSILFNSGILTINGVQIGEIQDITGNASKTEKNFYALGSKIKRAVRTSNFDMNISFNIQGALFRELIKTWFSSSSAVSTGLTYTPLDGIENAMSMSITAYENDDTNKWVQINVVGAVLLNHSITLASQEFITIPVEVACEYFTCSLATALTTT